MKILDWMHNKISRKQAAVGRRSCSTPKAEQYGNVTNNKVDVGMEDLADWSHGMLSIGTLGNNQFKLPSCDHLPELTNDDVEFSKSQLEMANFLKLKALEEEGAELDKTNLMLTLDKFLITLELDTALSTDENFEATSKVEKRRRSKRVAGSHGIKRKSLSFLLNNIFVNSGAPRLLTLPVSRMDTLLRTIMQKKIYPERSIRPPPGKLLRSRQHKNKLAQDDEEVKHQEKGKEECYKWVKTDSDFIVLEM